MKNYRFFVYIDNDLIGYSNFEFGDAPMGIAFGKFFTSENYNKYKKKIDECWLKQNFEELNVSVVEQETNRVVKYNFVAIQDYKDIEVNEIEITVNIGYPDYEEIFPNYIKIYKEQFPG